MDLIELIGGGAVLLLGIYLGFALLFPERLS